MRKIMFNNQYGLTKAVLEGRKTQTRRAIKLKDGEYVNVVALDNGSFMSYIAKEGKPTAHVGASEMPNFVRVLAPKYFIGEEVAISQSYDDIYMEKNSPCTIPEEFRLNAYNKGFNNGHKGWHNKMFVLPADMPFRIKITNIRIERLQDIKHHWTDALREGVTLDMDAPVSEQFYIEENGVNVFYLSAIDAFASLINKTCGKGTWDSNPYVFVYDFELVK